MDRLLYFGYVVVTSIRHGGKLLAFSRYYASKYERSAHYFLFMAYVYYIKHSMHPLDYFYFDVYKNGNFKPSEYANTLFMYRFHKRLNDKKYTKYFQDKILFHQNFEEFMGFEYLNLKTASVSDLRSWIAERKCDSLIVKKCKSVGGFGVKRIHVKVDKDDVYINNDKFENKIHYLRSFDLIEEFVYQHEFVKRLNQSCLNTIRVVTVLNENNKAEIIGAVLRLGVKADVDNFHSGGIAININIETGCLTGDGFRLAPGEPKFFQHHPVSQIKLNGYSLPHWDQVLDTVLRASQVIPQVRTVGWDVAIIPNGVHLIEGNNDWDKIIIEKALQRGIKKDLERYL